MKSIHVKILVCFLVLGQACSTPGPVYKSRSAGKRNVLRSTVIIKNKVSARYINTGKISANDVASYAETLQGVRYKWGSTSIQNGFDCSGFIYYVFTHFNIKVPRTSVEYTNAGIELLPEYSKRGDIILFTGSDPGSGIVGHMGMITKNYKGEIEFIHCASGEDIGVIISHMNSYFIPRFVKVIRVFK